MEQPVEGETVWTDGETLTLGGDISPGELRAVALTAAAHAWAGISAIRDRDESVLATADRFLAWLTSG